MAKAPPRIGARPPQTERERKQKLDKRRLSSSQRGYDADWQRVRDAVIIERGLRCEACQRLGVLRKQGRIESRGVSPDNKDVVRRFYAEGYLPRLRATSRRRAGRGPP